MLKTPKLETQQPKKKRKKNTNDKKPTAVASEKGVTAVGLNFYFTKIQNKIYYNVII